METAPDSSADRPLLPEQLAELRRQFATMSITALFDAYNAAWLRCKMENGKVPRAEHVQQMVTAWKELRKLGTGK